MDKGRVKKIVENCTEQHTLQCVFGTKDFDNLLITAKTGELEKVVEEELKRKIESARLNNSK